MLAFPESTQDGGRKRHGSLGQVRALAGLDVVAGLLEKGWNRLLLLLGMGNQGRANGALGQ